jgi:hypothetical protein
MRWIQKNKELWIAIKRKAHWKEHPFQTDINFDVSFRYDNRDKCIYWPIKYIWFSEIFML